MLKVKMMLMASLLFTGNTAFALQALDDESLSQATGQDGLTVTLQNFTPNARVVWTDTNGINAADGINPASYGLTGTPKPGSVVFGDGTQAGNFRISTGTTVITIDADSGATGPLLNINVDLPDDLTINTGDIYVAGKDTNNNLINQTRIMRDMTISLAGLNFNVQLGTEAQGGFIKLYGVLNDGLKVSNIGLIGGRSGTDEYGIGIQQMLIRDTGETTKLTFNGATIDVTDNGLLIQPSAGKQVDVLMTDVKFGNLSSAGGGVGNVALLGLKLGGMSLLVAGH